MTVRQPVPAFDSARLHAEGMTACPNSQFTLPTHCCRSTCIIRRPLCYGSGRWQPRFQLTVSSALQSSRYQRSPGFDCPSRGTADAGHGCSSEFSRSTCSTAQTAASAKRSSRARAEPKLRVFDNISSFGVPPGASTVDVQRGSAKPYTRVRHTSHGKPHYTALHLGARRADLRSRTPCASEYPGV